MAGPPFNSCAVKGKIAPRPFRPAGRFRAPGSDAGEVAGNIDGIYGKPFRAPGSDAQSPARAVRRRQDQGLAARLFSQIISTEMSPGETPGMRLAWPSDLGRWRSSFWRASMRRPERLR